MIIILYPTAIQPVTTDAPKQHMDFFNLNNTLRIARKQNNGRDFNSSNKTKQMRSIDHLIPKYSVHSDATESTYETLDDATGC